MREPTSELAGEREGDMDWQEIATAPEGVLLLLCSMDPNIALRDAYFVDWLVDGKLCAHFKRPGKPTHWMALPEPPPSGDSR